MNLLAEGRAPRELAQQLAGAALVSPFEGRCRRPAHCGGRGVAPLDQQVPVRSRPGQRARNL